MSKKYKIEMSYQNSMGGITNATRVVDAGINDNVVLGYIADLLRKDDSTLDFRISRAATEDSR